MLTINPVNSIMVTITSVNEKEENKGQLRISEIHITKEEILEIHITKEIHIAREKLHTSTQIMNFFEMGLHDEQFFAHGWISSKRWLDNLRRKKPPCTWFQMGWVRTTDHYALLSHNQLKFSRIFWSASAKYKLCLYLSLRDVHSKINTFLVKHQNWTMLVYWALTYSF